MLFKEIRYIQVYNIINEHEDEFNIAIDQVVKYTSYTIIVVYNK